MRKRGVIIVAQVLIIFLLVFIIHSSTPVGYNNIVSKDVQVAKWYDEANILHETDNIEIINDVFQNMSFKKVDIVEKDCRLLCELLHKKEQTNIYLVDLNQIAIQQGNKWYLSYRDEYILMQLKDFSRKNTK